jgi:hypothetical protein
MLQAYGLGLVSRVEKFAQPGAICLSGCVEMHGGTISAGDLWFCLDDLLAVMALEAAVFLQR